MPSQQGIYKAEKEASIMDANRGVTLLDDRVSTFFLGIGDALD